MSSASASPKHADEFARIRNRYLDQMALIEEKLVQIASKYGVEPKNAPVSQILSKLLRAEGPHAVTDATHAAITDALNDLAPRLTMRADIVHSRMKLGTRGEAPVAEFRNARYVNATRAEVTCLTSEEFATEVRHLQSIEGKLRSALNPPAQRQPKQGAAGDP